LLNGLRQNVIGWLQPAWPNALPRPSAPGVCSAWSWL